MTVSCLRRAGRMRRSKYFIYTSFLGRGNVELNLLCDEQGVYREEVRLKKLERGKKKKKKYGGNERKGKGN